MEENLATNLTPYTYFRLPMSSPTFLLCQHPHIMNAPTGYNRHGPSLHILLVINISIFSNCQLEYDLKILLNMY